jgi:hypothetical protein
MENDGFEIVTAAGCNRAERKARLKFYKKELVRHNRKEVKLNSNPAEESNFTDVHAWVTRKNTLLAKIKEYGG